MLGAGSGLVGALLPLLTEIKEMQKLGFPTWCNGMGSVLGAMGREFDSTARYSALRIWCCHSCRVAYNCILDLIPGLGIPYAEGRPKKKKKKKKKETQKLKSVSASGQVRCMGARQPITEEAAAAAEKGPWGWRPQEGRSLHGPTFSQDYQMKRTGNLFTSLQAPSVWKMF